MWARWKPPSPRCTIPARPPPGRSRAPRRPAARRTALAGTALRAVRAATSSSGSPTVRSARPDSASCRHELNIEPREPGRYTASQERHDRLGASLERAPRRLVIFDCDGVLVDSEVLACDVQARALTEYGLPLSGADVARRFLGMSAKDMRASLEVDLGRPLPAITKAVAARSFPPVPPRAEAGGRDCRRAGGDLRPPASLRRLELVARTHRAGARGGWPPEAFRPHVFSSTMVARGKPAPDLFLHAAKTMGFAAEGLRRRRGQPERRQGRPERRDAGARIPRRNALPAGSRRKPCRGGRAADLPRRGGTGQGAVRACRRRGRIAGRGPAHVVLRSWRPSEGASGPQARYRAGPR